jgi:hypothetical protein
MKLISRVSVDAALLIFKAYCDRARLHITERIL